MKFVKIRKPSIQNNKTLLIPNEVGTYEANCGISFRALEEVLISEQP